MLWLTKLPFAVVLRVLLDVLRAAFHPGGGQIAVIVIAEGEGASAWRCLCSVALVAETSRCLLLVSPGELIFLLSVVLASVISWTLLKW